MHICYMSRYTSCNIRFIHIITIISRIIIRRFGRISHKPYNRFIKLCHWRCRYSCICSCSCSCSQSILYHIWYIIINSRMGWWFLCWCCCNCCGCCWNNSWGCSLFCIIDSNFILSILRCKNIHILCRYKYNTLFINNYF